MAYVAKTCPSCGGALDNTPVCPYCGCKVEEENTEFDLDDFAFYSGEPTQTSLLTRATQLCNDEDFVNAENICERVLEADPECSLAHFLKFMCKKRFRLPFDVYADPEFESFSADHDFSRAMDFAEKDGMEEVYREWEEVGRKKREEKLAEQKRQEDEAREPLRKRMIHVNLFWFLAFSILMILNIIALTVMFVASPPEVAVLALLGIGIASVIEILIFQPGKTASELMQLIKRTADPIELNKKYQAEREKYAAEKAEREKNAERYASEESSRIQFEEDDWYKPESRSSGSTSSRRKNTEYEVNPEECDDPEEIERMLEEG